MNCAARTSIDTDSLGNITVNFGATAAAPGTISRTVVLCRLLVTHSIGTAGQFAVAVITYVAIIAGVTVIVIGIASGMMPALRAVGLNISEVIRGE